MEENKLKEWDLFKIFWESPPEAFFGQETVAFIRNVSVATMENNRWREVGIPYRKCSGRVLYRKSDVVAWIESHELVTENTELVTQDEEEK